MLMSAQVEKMPGPRCIMDGILLPNGHVLLIGGQKVWLAEQTRACMRLTTCAGMRADEAIGDSHATGATRVRSSAWAT